MWRDGTVGIRGIVGGVARRGPPFAPWLAKRVDRLGARLDLRMEEVRVEGGGWAPPSSPCYRIACNGWNHRDACSTDHDRIRR